MRSINQVPGDQILKDSLFICLIYIW